MKVTLLGTGTSNGVPAIGCSCKVCTSTDPRDRRLRSSALVETKGLRILIDCGPDFRMQMLTRPFAPLDAVLITHTHYDHVGGLDDLRPFCRFGPVKICGEPRALRFIRDKMPYAFAPAERPRVPHFTLCPLRPFQPLVVEGGGGARVEVLPLRVMHGRQGILAFRIGDFAYLTDVKTVPPATLEHLHGLRLLVVDGLRHKAHPTHQTVEDAATLAQRLAVPCTRIIHMAHSAGLHAQSADYLPAGVRFGFDGEELTL